MPVLLCGTQVYKIDDASAQFVEVSSLEEHDDIVSSVKAAPGHDGLVLSGSHDRRYGCDSSSWYCNRVTEHCL